MKYLVIGGTGFLGEKLVKSLNEKSNDIIVVSRGIIKKNNIQGVEYLHADRSNIHELQNILSNREFDLVIDLCCMKKEDARVLSKCNISYKKYIMISSIAVYPIEKNLEEDFFIDKSELSQYGREKKQAEDELIKLIDNDKLIIIRLSSLVGMGENGSVLRIYYDTISMEKSEFVGNMNSRLSLIELEDAVRFIKWISNKEFTGIINACSDNSIAIKEIINIAEKIVGKNRIPHEWDLDSRVVEQTMMNDKAKKLGFAFKRTEDLVYHYFNMLRRTAYVKK